MTKLDKKHSQDKERLIKKAHAKIKAVDVDSLDLEPFGQLSSTQLNQLIEQKLVTPMALDLFNELIARRIKIWPSSAITHETSLSMLDLDDLKDSGQATDREYSELKMVFALHVLIQSREYVASLAGLSPEETEALAGKHGLLD